MTDYKFSHDWFYWAPEVWAQLVPLLPERKNFLEIGSYEGRSAVWAAEHLLEDDGRILCVDTWEGGEEHKRGGHNLTEAEFNFDYNVATLHAKFPDRRIEKIKSTSHKAVHGMVPEVFINEPSPLTLEENTDVE